MVSGNVWLSLDASCARPSVGTALFIASCYLCTWLFDTFPLCWKAGRSLIFVDHKPLTFAMATLSLSLGPFVSGAISEGVALLCDVSL